MLLELMDHVRWAVIFLKRRLRLLLLQAADKTVAMVKSDKDNRYSSSEITTHDGVARSCYAVAQLANLRSALGQSYDSIQVIAIDEAQFFPDLLEFCTEASDHDNKHIVVAGLDGDFQRQRFGQVGVADVHSTCSVDIVAFGLSMQQSVISAKPPAQSQSRTHMLLCYRCWTLYLFQTV